MRRLIRRIAGASWSASGGLPASTVWSTIDAVFVVDDLCLVAELDRFAEPTLDDRAGIAVVQRHHPGCPVGGLPGETLPGLGGNPSRQLGRPSGVIDRAGWFPATGRPALIEHRNRRLTSIERADLTLAVHSPLSRIDHKPGSP